MTPEEIAQAFVEGKVIGLIGATKARADDIADEVRRTLSEQGSDWLWAKGSTRDRMRHATSGGEIRVFSPNPEALRGHSLDIVVMEHEYRATGKVGPQEIDPLLIAKQGTFAWYKNGTRA